MGKKGYLYVISGPSGAGKSTLRELLLRQLNLTYSISATTRPPRNNERDGVDYLFMSEDLFQTKIAEGEFLEWAKVFDQYYGTPLKPLMEHINSGRDVLLEIDVQGAAQIRERLKEIDLEGHFIFIAPPSLDVLKTRLSARGTETPESIELRLDEAEIEMAQSRNYDVVIVNDEIDSALKQIVEFIESTKANR